MKKTFNSNGFFWSLVIELINEEVLFFKNGEIEPFYYFVYQDWNNQWTIPHMMHKTWFTQEMADFITSNIQS